MGTTKKSNKNQEDALPQTTTTTTTTTTKSTRRGSAWNSRRGSLFRSSKRKEEEKDLFITTEDDKLNDTTETTTHSGVSIGVVDGSINSNSVAATNTTTRSISTGQSPTTFAPASIIGSQRTPPPDATATFTGVDKDNNTYSDDDEDDDDSVASTLSSSLRSPIYRSSSIVGHSTTTSSSARRKRRSVTYTPKTSLLSSIQGMYSLNWDRCKLHGREEETKCLREIITESATSIEPKPAVILVDGNSGVGKSSLVSESNLTGGHISNTTSIMYARGKFEEGRQQHIPYKGIAEACQQICDHILSSFLSDIRRIRKELNKSLGSSVSVLAQLAPSLIALTGTTTTSSSSSRPDERSTEFSNEFPANEASSSNAFVRSTAEETQHRFLYAMCTFIRIVAGCIAPMPLVLTIDDLQWADKESLKLLESLVQDQQNARSDGVSGGRLVLIGCYRGNEIDMTHPLHNFLHDWEEDREASVVLRKGVEDKKGWLTRLHLTDLDLSNTTRMISEVLKMEYTECDELASVVHERTLGNPFFVVQYLSVLQTHGLLSYNLGKMAWTWKLEEIRMDTVSTENVIDLLLAKMATLPSELCDILPLAACLGSTFTDTLLSAVIHVYRNEMSKDSNRDADVTACDKVSSAAADWLEASSKQGLLVELEAPVDSNANVFAWCHDKIREAALTIVTPQELTDTRFRVGEALLSFLSKDRLKENVFVIANLLGEGGDANLLQRDIRIKIAQVQLEAGHGAMSAASFESAERYFQQGISFLPESHWDTDYELSLDLFSSASECEFITGKLELMEEHCNAVIKLEDKPVLDKMRVYSVLIPCIGNKKQKYQEASDLAVNVLNELGCRLPRRALLFHVVKGFIGLKRTMKKVNPSDFIVYKEMTDVAQLRAIKILDILLHVAYHANNMYAPLSILKSFNWTVKHGTSEYAPRTFALISVILFTALKDQKASRAYGEVAASMIDSNPMYESATATTLLTLYCYIMPATISHKACMKPFYRGYESGMATGDIERGFINIYCYLEYCLRTGKKLTDLDKDYAFYANQMKSHDQTMQYNLSRLHWQTVRVLLGQSDDPLVLKGDIFDMDVEAKAYDKDRVIKNSFKLRQLNLYRLMCEDKVGAKFATQLWKDHKKSFGEFGPGTVEHDFLNTTVALVCLGTCRKMNTKKYMKLGKRAHKHVKQLGKNGNPNFLHFDQLIEAEVAAMKGSISTAKKHYENAIMLAARNGSISDQALASERYGDYMSTCDDENEALYRWQQARGLYDEWGAIAKVEQVESKLSTIRRSQHFVPEYISQEMLLET